MRRVLIVGLTLLLAACSSWLPSGESRIQSHWQSYDEARAAFDAVVPYQTSEEELTGLGFSPQIQPNVRILNYADIAERFLSFSLDRTGLAPGLRQCFENGEDCYGYELDRRISFDKRYGNFVADFLNFKRKTETRGWSFDALIVLIDGQVVYKLWSGTPEVLEYSDQTNPLGPLQGIGPSLTPRPSF